MATSPRRLAGLVFMLVLLASNLNLSIQDCNSSGSLQGQSGNCHTENNAECCRSDQTYLQFECSPPVTEETQATMTLNSFEDNGDGGGKSKCDETYHSNSELIVALSTGWFNDNNNRRCNQKIRINANDKSVLAEVVDECDSVNGCDKEHDFQPPCHNNIVDASQAVWDALEIHGSQVGKFDITWSHV